MWAICRGEEEIWTSSNSSWISALGALVTAPGQPEISSGLFSVTDHFAFDRPRIDSRETFFHRWREQRDVGNFAEMFGDEPDRFFRCHPVEAIEAGEIRRT